MNYVLETEKVFIGKRVRKYYKITSPGKKVVASKTNEVNDFIETLSLIFNPKKLAK